MDVSEIANQLGENLEGLGWHINLKQKMCPDGCGGSFSMEESYCSYCGAELEIQEEGIEDLKVALRGTDAFHTDALQAEFEEEVPEEMVEVKIPVVLDPSGRANAMYWHDEDGEPQTDEALIYEHWHQKEDPVLQKVYVTARIDLDSLFEGRVVDGTVTEPTTDA